LKTNSYSKTLTACFLILIVCSLAPTIRAQADPQTGLIGEGKKAYSIPVSDREIQFKVAITGGEDVTIRVKEGGMAKIYAFKAGFAYAIVPVGRGIDNNSADFSIYRLTQDANGNESIRLLEHVTAGVGGPGFSTPLAEPKLRISLIRISSPKQVDNDRRVITPKNHPQIAFAPAAVSKDCCVTARLL